MVVIEQLEATQASLLDVSGERVAVIFDQISVPGLGLRLRGNPSPHQISLAPMFAGWRIGPVVIFLSFRKARVSEIREMKMHD
jgi:hypothetical protein